MHFVLAFLLACSCFESSASAQNQKSKPVSAQVKVPDDLKKMLEEFSQALSHNDKAKASQLSQFPLKNLVYGEKKQLDQKGFESYLKESTPGFCYDSSLPEKDKKSSDWILNCDGNLFYFGQIKGKWKYLGYENINE